jgi:hypothetical protein
VELLRADDGAEAARYAVPKPKGRFCTECGAFVTTLGRTEGVFCDRSGCPFPQINRGGVPPLPADHPAPTPMDFPDEPHRQQCGRFSNDPNRGL